MLRTLASGSEQVVNCTEVLAFARQRRLERSEDLSSRGDRWTFIVNLVNLATPDMQEMHHALWAAFGLGGGFNAYLTPPGSQGLAPHVDGHDVFVLQQSGRKEWHLLNRETWSEETTVTLSAGDVLYLPEGVPHYARSAGGEPSLHLAASVHRSHFSAAGVLAAWLELSGASTRDLTTLTPEGAEGTAFWHRRLAAQGGPWSEGEELLPSALSDPLLRALDWSDLPATVASKATAALLRLAAELSRRMLEAPTFLDREAGAALGQLASLPEAAAREQLMSVMLAVRQYHWVKHYSINRPKPLTHEHAHATQASLRYSRLRRSVDSTAMLVADGTFVVNGHGVGDLTPEQRRAMRFCMGMHTGAACKEFRLSEVPCSCSVAGRVAMMLLQLNGLEITQKCGARGH